MGRTKTLATKLVDGLLEDGGTLDAMMRRVMSRARDKDQDPEAAWREAEPTYRGMLGEPDQQQAIASKEDEQADHEQGEVEAFQAIHDRAEEAMRGMADGPARQKAQQIMLLAQELLQQHEA